MNNKYIGEKIRFYRQKHGYTQQQLADKIGVSWEMVSRYERGSSSSISKIELISEHLNILPVELLSAGYKNEDIHYPGKNLVPLLQINPGILTLHNFNDLLLNTNLYYSAPDWILIKYNNPFCLNYSDIISKSVQIKENGIIYFATSDYIDKKAQFVLVLQNMKLELLPYKKGIENMVGLLLAQEVRFV